MLEDILAYLKNWFVSDTEKGHFIVEDGQIALPHVVSGQYYRIIGSTFNDGVYKHGEETLTDEVFDGIVWALAIPRRLLELESEIKAWQEKNGAVSASPYASESFGGYSYSRATNPTTGGAVTWQSAFSQRLNRWRKI